MQKRKEIIQEEWDTCTLRNTFSENKYLFVIFKENNNAVWVIADRIRVTRILSEEERQYILKEANYDEMEAFEPYKQAMAKRMKAV